jgi:hypothetical protein
VNIIVEDRFPISHKSEVEDLNIMTLVKRW